jgi:hypothetical protein
MYRKKVPIYYYKPSEKISMKHEVYCRICKHEKFPVIFSWTFRERRNFKNHSVFRFANNYVVVLA